ncbi:MAG: peptide chain release factor 3, partial [Oscillospiraceae bacterium]|nr:peptide chain release factor 3 [Oscillospiraceae bacterium]
MKDIKQEIERRRTFAIISHPDAGKTTLTEKLLLYGGAIQSAGSVKGKSSDRHAVSDWMEIERQRGISVTSSVLQFEYRGHCINILDTPGHQDFSEDTYRTLMAADSAIMVIDAAKGIEPQTRKLFQVVSRRGIPIFTFINKLDHEARDPFSLLDELEQEFGIATYPMNWPISCGVTFKGVYDRESREVLTYGDYHGGAKKLETERCSLEDAAALDALIGERFRSELAEAVELLDGAGADFDEDAIHHGKLSPVFFGSALHNFGVEQFLDCFLRFTTPPLPRKTAEGGLVDPMDEGFSAFVFKIQANMNKAHRDRVSFLRVCSGRFERGKEYYHVQGGKTLRLSQPQQLMAQERDIVNEAYAGDILGVFDPGVFSIGDTVCEPGREIRFSGIPTFAPEHFAVIEQIDSMKRKQFAKGMSEIAQE